MKILTFDIEDWFHILDNPSTANPESWERMPTRFEKSLDYILEVLNSYNQPATFFCLGWIAKRYPTAILKILNEGHHIASHSNTHQLAYTQTKSEFTEDLKISIHTLEDLLGKKIDTYRAPGFSITEENLWAFEVMDSLGIVNDCSVFPASRAHGGIPSYKVAKPTIIKYKDAKLRSFPINTTNFLGKDIVYSGGGYFRLFPLYFLNKRFEQDDYVMTYFHPRDFDPNQPIVKGLNFFRIFKSYVGISGAKKKLEKLLCLNNFINVEMASKKVNWSSVDTINLYDENHG